MDPLLNATYIKNKITMARFCPLSAPLNHASLRANMGEEGIIGQGGKDPENSRSANIRSLKYV